MKVAKTYQNWKYDETKAYEKSGKKYVTATCKCDRCVKGVFVCRVENGQPVPHPAYGGVCLKCGGTGELQKEIRLYTDAEFERMEKANEKAREKRQAEQEEKMQREFAHKKEVWLKTNGFNENEETYIVLGNSYEIKDALKEAGFHFNGILKRWMRGEDTDMLINPTIKVNANEIVEFSAWGEGHFLSNAKEIVDAYEKELIPEEPSEWVGEIGKRMNFTVSLERKGGFQGKYGYSNIYTFKDREGNILTWFSSVDLQKDVGDTFTLTATVKDHTTYNGKKQTLIARARIAKE